MELGNTLEGREPFPLLSSPARVFALVLLLVFAVEGVIMLALPALPEAWRGSAFEGLLDASALTAITAPAVWFLLVLPLRRSIATRGHLLHRLFDSHEQEAARLARDLHDGVGQNLTALLLGLRRVADADDLQTAKERASDLAAIASLAHAEVRDIARGLHPPLLREHGLVVAIQRLSESFEQAHGIRVVFTAPADPPVRLPLRMEVAFYRVVQEGLANVARHAQAENVEIFLEARERRARLVIRDDGVGMTSAAHGGGSSDGFGLGSIRERVLMLGGTCRIRSTPGNGTTIEIRAPAGPA
jgi:signal transduction histidine kinase